MKRLSILASIALCSLWSCTSTKTPAECVEKINADCVCTMQYDPVCGCNGKTYGNACQAGCAGITSFTKGECKE